RRRHTRFSRDWSSDVCSSDLTAVLALGLLSAPVAVAKRVDQDHPMPSTGKVRITGHGYGHGHGMSQHGAQGAALQGLNWRQIVRSEERRVGKERRTPWQQRQ